MKNLNTKLNTLTTNKVEINNLIATNKALISDIFPILNKEVKRLRDLPIYKDTKKSVLLAKIKGELDTKEAIVNTALNLLTNNLSIDTTLSLGQINQIITMFNKKELSKNQINKATKEELIIIIRDANKAKKLVSAKATVAKARKATKPANKTTKAKATKTA